MKKRFLLILLSVILLLGIVIPVSAVAETTASDVLEVSVQNGETVGFSMEDLETIWQEEGSKEYLYSTYNTWPTFETEEHYGPTVRAILSAANIEVDTLADNDVIVFGSSDGYTSKMTVKDFKKTRYYFPNGQTPNGARFQGTTAAQLVGMVEVPYIVCLQGGANNLRNVCGQQDPQEEQRCEYCQYLSTITVLKDPAPTFTGCTPTIQNGSAVNEGDKLNFDISTSPWRGGASRYAWIYYTVSTDGTDPADPTFSDILYNYKQYGKPSYVEEPEVFNSYVFTDAATTIIKYIVYVRGYTEPQVMTLRYTNAAAAEPTYEFTSSKGTALKARETTTLTATVTGGAGNYTYKFIVHNEQTGEWFKIRDFTSSNTCDWYTGVAGNKTLYVDVKDSSGAVKRLKLPVTVSESSPAPLAVTSFTSSKGTALSEKTNTSLTAKATGGKAPYTYKFIVYNKQTGQWYKIRDFASANTCDWYTGVGGFKTLYVDVKDSAGTVVRQALDVTVGSPLSAKTFTSSKGTGLKSNDTTTLTGEAAGGSGSGYTYKFIVYNTGSGAWYKIQDYSTKKTASWYTGAAGKKILYLDIRDSAGNYIRTPLNVTVA